MHVSQWDTYSLQDAQDRGSPQTHLKKRATLVESLCRCVPYEKKGSRWTAVTAAVTLHITKDTVPVCTVKKQEVYPHAKNVRPQVCATKPKRGLKPEEADRLVFLAKNV